MGILTALVLKKTVFKGEPVPFVMELPNYRMPSPKNVAQLLWDKAKDFLQRAFTVIFIASIVIWFLQTFDLQLHMVTDSQNSMLAMIAGSRRALQRAYSAQHRFSARVLPALYPVYSGYSFN